MQDEYVCLKYRPPQLEVDEWQYRVWSGESKDSCHVSDDEFYVQHDDFSVPIKALNKVRKWLSEQKISGEGIEYSALGLVWG
ncbi:hypothetical protein [Microbulbifer thermotolerans]|uniref:hypothetical protein n=1 Tax=Microbulbifer thermotolerans TaxID=252514 RepID=UPI002248A57E|nr:hypothetical protein [Microbulbifer thermotolerans]MCX2830813.1 hypothetical protein [Microbulbifer thermotolerans]